MTLRFYCFCESASTFETARAFEGAAPRRRDARMPCAYRPRACQVHDGHLAGRNWIAHGGANIEAFPRWKALHDLMPRGLPRRA
jgi:hypothetical protein